MHYYREQQYISTPDGEGFQHRRKERWYQEFRDERKVGSVGEQGQLEHYFQCTHQA